MEQERIRGGTYGSEWDPGPHPNQDRKYGHNSNKYCLSETTVHVQYTATRCQTLPPDKQVGACKQLELARTLRTKEESSQGRAKLQHIPFSVMSLRDQRHLVEFYVYCRSSRWYRYGYRRPPRAGIGIAIIRIAPS